METSPLTVGLLRDYSQERSRRRPWCSTSVAQKSQCRRRAQVHIPPLAVLEKSEIWSLHPPGFKNCNAKVVGAVIDRPLQSAFDELISRRLAGIKPALQCRWTFGHLLECKRGLVWRIRNIVGYRHHCQVNLRLRFIQNLNDRRHGLQPLNN